MDLKLEIEGLSVTIDRRTVSVTLVWIGLRAYDIIRGQPYGFDCFRVIDMQKTNTQYLTGGRNRSLNLPMVVKVAGVGLSVVGPSVGLGVVVGDSVADVGAGNVNGANVYRMYAEPVTTGDCR